MIIVRSPFRISFFGGGSDLPISISRHPGHVLSTTIDKYCYVSLRALPPFFDFKYRISYSKVESVTDISCVEHRAVRAALETYDISDGVEIHCDQDLPARSGIGSSSSFSTALIRAIYAYQNKLIDKRLLAEESVRLEREILLEYGGLQDQYAASFGGLNHMVFRKDTPVEVNPLTLAADRLRALESSLLLFFTGVTRIASHQTQILESSISSNTTDMSKTSSYPIQALDILYSTSSLDNFGELLHDSWLEKRSHHDSVSSPLLDSYYHSARQAGAIGGKVLGAGGGGFMLFYVANERKADVLKALSHLLHVPFRFENHGSSLIYYSP